MTLLCVACAQYVARSFTILLLLSLGAVAHAATAAPTATDARVVTPAPKTAIKNKRSFDFNYKLYGESLTNAIGGEKSVFGAQVMGKYKEYFTPQLMAKIQGGIKLESGREESVSADSENFNQLFLHQASLHWRPWRGLSLRGGALNQSFIGMPLLLDSRAFPAAQQAYHYKAKKWWGSFTLQQAIPTSQSLSTKVVENEESPYLLTGTGKFKFKLTQRLRWELRGTYFSFYNLPSVVAEESGRHGNIVNEISVNQSAFREPFEGYHVRTSFEWVRFFGRNMKLNLNFLENSLSTTDDNTGVLGTIEIPVAIGSTDVILRAEQFELGATASPAFYNDFQYGHNNRQGYAVGVAIDLKDPQFQLAIKYIDSQVIEPNANQYDEKSIFITAGVLNDLF